jgi:hypothetical protein
MVVEAAATAYAFAEGFREKIVQGAAKIADGWPAGIRGVPRILELAAPLLLGWGPTMTALLTVAGIEREEDLSPTVVLGLEGVMSAIHLRGEEGDFLSAAQQVRESLAGGVTEEDLSQCAMTSILEKLPYRDVFAAVTALAKNKMTAKELPALVQIHRETAMALPDIVERLAA